MTYAVPRPHRDCARDVSRDSITLAGPSLRELFFVFFIFWAFLAAPEGWQACLRDGAKDGDALLEILGEGPATSTPAEAK